MSFEAQNPVDPQGDQASPCPRDQEMIRRMRQSGGQSEARSNIHDRDRDAADVDHALDDSRGLGQRHDRGERRRPSRSVRGRA